MAKMFYSLEEAAQKLGKTPDQLKEMAASGQLQEFKDRDKLMFKREQVDLLSGGGKGDSGMIPLAENAGSSLGLSLEDSGAGSKAGSKGGSGHIELDDPAAKEKSGISIFDTESTDESDPSAVTRITETKASGDELTLESVGSGSGLLDLTREGDDTSLGADLLEDVYKPDEEPAAGASETTGASGLFETTAAPSDVAAAAAAAGMPIGMIAVEPYDGSWSGISGGLALGATLIAAVSMIAVMLGLMNADNPIATAMGANLMMWVGIFAGGLLLMALIGWALGRRT